MVRHRPPLHHLPVAVDSAALFQSDNFALSNGQELTFNWSEPIFQSVSDPSRQHVPSPCRKAGPGSPGGYQGRAAVRPPTVRQDHAHVADRGRRYPVHHARRCHRPRRCVRRSRWLRSRSRQRGHRRDPARSGARPGNQDHRGRGPAPRPVPAYRVRRLDDAPARRGLTCGPHGDRPPAAAGPGGAARRTHYLSRRGICRQAPGIPNPGGRATAWWRRFSRAATPRH